MSQPNQTINDDEAEFVPLKGFEQNYEIQKDYPFVIRNKKTGRILSESLSDGYVQVNLNRRPYRKHILIGKQFITNDDPEHKTELDHVNRDRSDYHLSNLRWVSRSENQKNRTSYKGVQYEYVDDIPDDAIIIDYYETKTERREFEEGKYYFYHDESTNEDKFYGRITDNLYRVLHINTNKSGNEFVSMKDINNQKVGVYINKFKYQRDLL